MGKTPSGPAAPSAPTEPSAQPQQAGQQAQQPAQQAGQAAQPQQPSATQSDLQARLLEQINQISQAPSAYSTQDIQQMREAQRAEIEAQFGAQRQELEEELARRGISASSIAAGRLGDLAGQQARAVASMEAVLTDKAAQSLERGRKDVLAGFAQAAGLELESKGLDLQSKKVQADIDAEAKRLMQADRSLDLQSARDQAQKSIAFAQLREQAASRVSREKLTIAQMEQQSDQFAQSLGLDRDRLNQQIFNEAEQIRIQDRSIDETTAHNMAMESIARDTLDQRVAEAAEAARQFGLTFNSQQEFLEFAQKWMLENAVSQGAPSGFGNTYGSSNGEPQFDPEGILEGAD